MALPVSRKRANSMAMCLPRQRGFLLVMVMVMLAILTVVVATLVARVDRNREQVQYLRDRGEALTALFEADQQLKFQLAASPLTNAGAGMSNLNPVRLDGRAYELRPPAGGVLRVELQDTGGLIDLNYAGRFMLGKYLLAHGVAADAAERLLDTLDDYKDSDDLRSPRGAEAPEYQAAGLPPPANDRLRTPHELYNVMGWRDILTRGGGAATVDGATVSRGVGVNPATASREVLMALGMSAESASALAAARRAYGSIDPNLLTSALGDAGFSMFMVIPAPSGIVRARLAAPALPWAVEYNLRLTPSGKDAPWQIDYFMRAQKSRDAPNASLPPLPPLPDASQIPQTPLLAPF